MNKIPEICFKTELIFHRFSECHPILQNIALEMRNWCVSNNCPFLITASKSTDAEDRALNRISKTHKEGRAIDLTSKGWSKEKIEEFIAYFSHKYADVAAIGINGPRLILYHNSGNGEHFHVQIKPQSV